MQEPLALLGQRRARDARRRQRHDVFRPYT